MNFINELFNKKPPAHIGAAQNGKFLVLTFDSVEHRDLFVNRLVNTGDADRVGSQEIQKYQEEYKAQGTASQTNIDMTHSIKAGLQNINEKDESHDESHQNLL